MGLFSKLDKSAALVTGMADRLDADLIECLRRDPDNTTMAYRSMVYRCSACSNQDGCATLQAANPRLDEAPEYCLNKQALDRSRGR